MNPINQKKLLIERFRKNKLSHPKHSKKLVTFKELNIKIEKETYEWYQQVNGGGNYE